MNQYRSQPDLLGKELFTVLGPARNTLTIAARELENVTEGTEILEEFDITPYVANDFTFDYPVGDNAARPATWQLAVRTVDSQGNVYRYVLIPPQLGGILYPSYEGQKLFAANVHLEIWSVAGQADAEVTETVLTLGTFNRPDGTVVLNNGYSNAGTNTTL